MADFVRSFGQWTQTDIDRCIATAYATPLYMEQLARQGKTPEQACQEQAAKVGTKTQKQLEEEAWARESGGERFVMKNGRIATTEKGKLVTTTTTKTKTVTMHPGYKAKTIIVTWPRISPPPPGTINGAPPPSRRHGAPPPSNGAPPPPSKPLPLWPFVLGALGLAGGGYWLWRRR